MIPPYVTPAKLPECCKLILRIIRGVMPTSHEKTRVRWRQTRLQQFVMGAKVQLPLLSASQGRACQFFINVEIERHPEGARKGIEEERHADGNGNRDYFLQDKRHIPLQEEQDDRAHADHLGHDQIHRHGAEKIALFAIEAHPARGAIGLNREPVLEYLRLTAVWANAPGGARE